MIKEKGRSCGVVLLCINFKEHYHGKFIYIFEKKTRQLYIVLSHMNEEFEYHVNIVKYLKNKSEIKDFEVKGGGYFVLDNDNINVFDESMDYGAVDKKFIIEVLDNIFPGRKTETW